MSASGLPASSPFSPLESERIIFEDDATVAFSDRYPVSPGHTLVVCKQVTASLFDLPVDRQASLWGAVATVRSMLQEQLAPNGFNIGLNDGPAGGQTIAHAHIHIIPRYAGDQDDPRGGVRWVFPEKARYWETPKT